MSKTIYNRDGSTWLRPWNVEKFDDLYERDDRYFAILIKGTLSWLTDNILLYNKGINHFLLTTGSSYLYVEKNGYKFSMNETSGEDYMYMKMPRCVMELGDIDTPEEELSAPYVRGTYERRDGNDIKGYNAQMRRMPIEMSMTAHYVLSNFNEAIILLQELIDRVSFQSYFNIVYLGQVIQCSIEIDKQFQIQLNKIDMTNPETNQKTIDINYKICSNYPCIDERTEIENSSVMSRIMSNLELYKDKKFEELTDSIEFDTQAHEEDPNAGNILAHNGDGLIKTKFSEIKNIRYKG